MDCCFNCTSPGRRHSIHMTHLWLVCALLSDPPFAAQAASLQPGPHQAAQSWPGKLPESSPGQHWGRLACQAGQWQQGNAEVIGLLRVVWERMLHELPHGRPCGGYSGTGPHWPSCLRYWGLVGWICQPVLRQRHPAHSRRLCSGKSNSMWTKKAFEIDTLIAVFDA